MSAVTESVKPSVETSVEETRTGLCEEFASITGSDSAVAQCYLAENEWEMERALNSFFEADMEAVFEVADSPEWDSSPKVKRQKVDNTKADCIDLTEEEPASSSSKSTAAKVEPKSPRDPGLDGKLSLITWNVDGLDTDNLGDRARGLCSYLALYTPDVVLLQELIPQYVQYLKKRAVSYTIIEGGEEGYFTGLMLKKSTVKLLNSEIVGYPSSQMMRNLLIAQVRFMGQELCLMTSHFESCKGQSEERMKQLKVVLKRMKEAPGHVTALFGGDTNLRDTEVAKVGGLPAGVSDVWERLGKQEHCRYTWDTRANSNKSVPYVSRCRFDRVYLRPAMEGSRTPLLAPDHMDLLGQEKLDCGRYTSDHWGIYCSFTVGQS
ncbi:tyrosyl-DNA phosphodiesterase 2 [Hypomesus transpacificus]|uniref:tyrosyl-DNA phosphodiesterase 2 n=1 Tax=Hypomesus transpacificus TaxID=137520 RepID=UPI001F07D72C|nr:tyrosyl-DNA phosphodiesterase 2 [Hypomesus transpacificus]